MTQDSPRTIWSLTGKDALSFLQGLVTNDLRPLETDPGIVWAAIAFAIPSAPCAWPLLTASSS